MFDVAWVLSMTLKGSLVLFSARAPSANGSVGRLCRPHGATSLNGAATWATRLSTPSQLLVVTTLTVSGTTSRNGDVNLGDTTVDTITVAGVTNLDHTLTVAGDTTLNALQWRRKRLGSFELPYRCGIHHLQRSLSQQTPRSATASP